MRELRVIREYIVKLPDPGTEEFKQFALRVLEEDVEGNEALDILNDEDKSAVWLTHAADMGNFVLPSEPTATDYWGAKLEGNTVYDPSEYEAGLTEVECAGCGTGSKPGFKRDELGLWYCRECQTTQAILGS